MSERIADRVRTFFSEVAGAKGSAARIAFIIAFSVFACEALVMVVFSTIPPFTIYMEALLDAAMLTLLLAPVLYFFLFRPVMAQTRKCRDAELALHAISEAVSSETGEPFFRELVLSLTKMLKTDYAFIGEIVDDRAEKVRSIAACSNGVIVDNFEYELKDTPFENVAGKTLSSYTRGVQLLFPKDPLLREMGADGYMGIPIFDSEGAPLGILAVLTRKPLERHELLESVLKVFSFRAAAEMEHRRAAELFREVEETLRKAQKFELMGSMAAGVAHEVRNPLNSLMALTDALYLELGEKSNCLTYLDHIHDQVNRLSELMRDLLELGKPVRKASLVRADLLEICRSAAGLCCNPEKKDTLAYTCRIIKPAGDGPIPVVLDAERLKHVFLNLLENAAHHSPEGSEVQLVIEEPSLALGRCTVKVVDRGSGVTEDIRSRIFDPFFSTRRGGTGLGLSIVKNIVESFGGSVALYNNDPGPGCTAEVTLPLADTSSALPGPGQGPNLNAAS